MAYWGCLGFLICVPMKEEWKSEAGIQVLEGWSFQVRGSVQCKCGVTIEICAVFVRVGGSLPSLSEAQLLSKRAQVRMSTSSRKRCMVRGCRAVQKRLSGEAMLDQIWTRTLGTFIRRLSVSDLKQFSVSPRETSLPEDREIEIVQALLGKVLVHEKAINHACDVCAELDCLISFAQASQSYDYRKPYMTQDNIIDIKQGR